MKLTNILHWLGFGRNIIPAQWAHLQRPGWSLPHPQHQHWTHPALKTKPEPEQEKKSKTAKTSIEKFTVYPEKQKASCRHNQIKLFNWRIVDRPELQYMTWATISIESDVSINYFVIIIGRFLCYDSWWHRSLTEHVRLKCDRVSSKLLWPDERHKDLCENFMKSLRPVSPCDGNTAYVNAGMTFNTKYAAGCNMWPVLVLGSDLQTWRWRRSLAVETKPCSLSSAQTPRLLWTRRRYGRRQLSHRPRSFYLEVEGDRRQGELTKRSLTRPNRKTKTMPLRRIPAMQSRQGNLLHHVNTFSSFHRGKFVFTALHTSYLYIFSSFLFSITICSESSQCRALLVIGSFSICFIASFTQVHTFGAFSWRPADTDRGDITDIPRSPTSRGSTEEEWQYIWQIVPWII